MLDLASAHASRHCRLRSSSQIFNPGDQSRLKYVDMACSDQALSDMQVIGNADADFYMGLVL